MRASIPGVTLTLNGKSDAGATVIDHATTDSTGHYLFTEVPGTYTVTVDASNFTGTGALVGYTASPTLQGGNTALDSNPNPSGTTPTDLTPGGSSDLTVDFGYYQPATLAGLGDYVWNDVNANGIQDTGEAGIKGVTVTLYDSSKTKMGTTTTNATGLYHFINLLPGTYYVGFTAPNGYKFSPQYAKGSTTSNDSNANITTGMSDAITLIAGQTNNTIDAGLWKPAPNLFDPPLGIKVLSASNLPELEWQMTWINNANALAINAQVTDPIPTGTAYVLNSLTCVANGASTTTLGLCILNSSNQIFWQGSIAPDPGVTDPKNAVNSVVITFRVTVLNGVNNVNNQASSITDTTGNGTFVATSTSVSDSNIASWSRNSGRGGGGNGSINGVNPAAQLPSTGFAPGVITSIAPEPANVYDTSSDLTIEIPALGIKTAIVGVPQSDNTWDITWLGDQVGYLNGTAFPTWSGNSVLTGHVYESNGLPGPFVNLSTLKWGDQIIVHFAGQRYIYQVRENNVILPSDKSVFKHEDQPWLTLVTCKDYNASANTYKYRVTVGAVLIKIEPETSINPTGK